MTVVAHHGRSFRLLPVVALISLPLLAAGSGRYYAANRTRVYADANPPLYWDATNGVNILWKTPLPNWSNGSPLFVPDAADKRPGAGRIFAISEPLDYAPILTAYDALTGKELWRCELDPVAAFPAAEQEELRKLAHDGWTWKHQMVRLWNDVREYIEAHLDMFEGNYKVLKDDARPAFESVFGKRLADLGLTFKSIIRGAGGELTQFSFIDDRGPESELVKKLQSVGLAWEHWAFFGTYTGLTYGTPASDGKRVFTVTGQGLFACHDLDGKLVWQQRFWPENGQKYQGLFATSPVYAQGLFMSQGGATIRAFDAATGAVRWSAPMAGCFGQNAASPAIIELGGEAFLVAADSGKIYRVRDGRECGVVPGGFTSKMAIAGPIIEKDVVVGFMGDERKQAIAAHRLAHDAAAETVTVNELWRKPQGRVSLWQACIHEGRLHTMNAVLDVLTGETPLEKLPHAHNNYCWWSAIVAGDHYLTIDHAGGTFLYRDLARGREVSRNTLPTNPPEVHDAAKVRANGQGSAWKIVGAATPEAVGERLYVRSFDYLWCIGPSVRGTPADNPKIAEELRHTTSVAALEQALWSDNAQYRYEAAVRTSRVGALDAGPGVRELLQHLATEDRYAEIRAAALVALGLNVDAPGWEVLRRYLVSKADGPGRLNDQQVFLTLRALGEPADRALAGMLAHKEAVTRRVAASAIGGLGRRGDAVRDALIVTLTGDKDEWLLRHAVAALAAWTDDAKVSVFFHGILNSKDAWLLQPDAYEYVLRTTPPAGRTDLMKRVAASNPHANVRTGAIDALIELANTDEAAFSWLMDRARLGDGLIAERMAGLRDAEKRRTAMLDLLTSEESVHAAARVMFWNNIEPVAAGRALLAVMGKLAPRDLGYALEGIWHCTDPEGRKVGVEILGELPGHADRQVRAWALQGLGEMGADAAPHLGRIEALQTGDDKGLADLRRRVLDQVGKKQAEEKKP